MVLGPSPADQHPVPWHLKRCFLLTLGVAVHVVRDEEVDALYLLLLDDVSLAELEVSAGTLRIP